MLKISSRVKTVHGEGEIVGTDCGGHGAGSSHRWRVRIDNPVPKHAEMVARFPGGVLVYFQKEVTANV